MSTATLCVCASAPGLSATTRTVRTPSCARQACATASASASTSRNFPRRAAARAAASISS